MNNMQKQYAAFMESICTKYKCESALPALQEGFKTLCEAGSRVGDGINDASSCPVQDDGHRKATYDVAFDCIDTIHHDIEAGSVEEAVEKARKMITKDMQVCEIWCCYKTLTDGTVVYLAGAGSDEDSYTEGGWASL